MLTTRIAGYALAATLVAAPLARAAEPPAVLPPSANPSPLTAGEVYRLYSGNTWRWEGNGAAYLAPSSIFAAWSRSDDSTTTYARGRWYATASGEMCFRAVWYANGQGAEAKTCFSHARLGSTIYQRKGTDGDWYVFKHEDANPSDEVNGFAYGDQVSAKVDRLATAMLLDKN